MKLLPRSPPYPAHHSSGAYASASEAVRVLLDRDAAVERWLREEVVPGYQEYLTDRTKGVPVDAVLKRIKPRYGAHKPE